MMTNASMTNGSAQQATCNMPPTTEQAIMAVYLIIILILTVLGNLLVISVVIKYQRLQQVTNYFIVSLAVSDLLIAVLTFPLTINVELNNGLWCLNLPTCGFWLVVDVTCSYASICNLAAISIDRLIAITMPFRYREIVTRNRVFCVIGGVWTFCLVWGALLLLNWTDPGKPGIVASMNGLPHKCVRTEPIYYTVAIVIAFFVPLLIIITAYSIILRVAITQAKAVAALDPNRDRRKKTNFFREVKATKVVALVIGAFVLSWLPLFILLLVSLWNSENTKEFARKYPKLHKAILFTFVRVLPPLSSCINPIIYALFNSNFRSAFLLFLRCPQRLREDANESMMTTRTRDQRRSSYSTMVTDTENNNNIT